MIRPSTSGVLPLFSGLVLSAASAQAGSLAELPPVTPEQMPGCAAPVAAGGEWPSYGHDLANTRSQPLESQISPANVDTLAQHFVFDTQDYQTTDGEAGEPFIGPFFNTPVVADGCLYNAAADGTVFAVNADTGKLVWKTVVEDDIGYAHLSGGGPTIGSVTVDQVRNRIFVLVTGEGDPNEDDGEAGSGDPYVAALDQATGRVIWRSASLTPQDDVKPEADDALTYFLSSTVLFENTIIASFGGNAGQRYYRGGIGFVDADSGEVVKITNLLSQEDFDNEFSGGSIWATGVVDAQSKSYFVGTGNPGAATREHKWTNAIIKMDVDRASPSFGEITASYKGDNDHYVPGLEFIDETGCMEMLAANFPYPANSVICAQLDLDFGASPNLLRAPDGRLLVGEMQKSGTYHVAYADSMEPAWKSIIGTPCFPCNTASSAVVNDTVFVVGAPPRTMFALKDGGYEWLSPITANGIHYQAVSAANGVVYTFDATNLHAWDAANGSLLLRKQLNEDQFFALPDEEQVAEVSGGNLSHPATAAVLNSDSSGIAIARNTLYVAGGHRIYAMRLASAAGDEGDVDGDGIANAQDNCAGQPNPDQQDSDNNAVGDACQARAASLQSGGQSSGQTGKSRSSGGCSVGAGRDASLLMLLFLTALGSVTRRLPRSEKQVRRS